MTRLPLLDAITDKRWAELIQRAALAPKGKKREREAELRAFVHDGMAAAQRVKSKRALKGREAA